MSANSSSEKSYIIVNENTVSPGLLKQAHADLEDLKFEVQIKAEADSLEISDEIYEFCGRLAEWTKNFQTKLGIEPLVPEVFLSLQAGLETFSGKSALQGNADILPRVITLHDVPTGYQESEPVYAVVAAIKLFSSCKTIAHEYHHQLTKEKLYLNEDVQNIGITSERSGLKYLHHGQSGNAVEEGLTVLFEYMAMEAVTQSPEIQKGKNAFTNMLAAEMNRDPNFRNKLVSGEIPVESLLMQVIDRQLVFLVEYPNSVKLVKYLKAVVPNFIQLAEKARIELDTLPLARAIEATFGCPTVQERGKSEDPYYRIMMATEESAEQLLVYLKARIALKPHK